MEDNLKYDIENLEWQQFEILSFKCLQLDISKSLIFIEGGNDKGRDFIFNGKTNFWGIDDKEYKYIFQAKHKSKKESFSSLNNDLKTELEKVFITNKFCYNYYCLVTNLTLTGNQTDSLNATFSSFISDNQLSTQIKFGIYSYRNLEGCIDRNDFLKWIFPSIIRNADFKFLLEGILQRNANNIVTGWLSVFEKNKVNFVYTNVFEKAIDKLKNNNILLLSGPSKSGKTYNAEMLLFNYFCTHSYTPYKIDRVDEFDKFYDPNKKQVFLFDDAFGRYNIDLSRADSFNRKLEYIFEQMNETHKCIFTTREYIYKAFIDYVSYSEPDVKEFIAKITVEVNDLTKGEKESIFYRYFKHQSNHRFTISDKNLDRILEHRNFSPETIRAYFAHSSNFDLAKFIQHIESPDDYLEKDFINLSEEKKIVLLSTLLSLTNTTNSIAYSYETICNDLNKNSLISLNELLNQLDGSILKSDNNEYYFYHPSMFEFFVRYISKDTSIYRRLILINFNIRLLNVLRFKPEIGQNAIKIDESDLTKLIEGFHRIFNNPGLSIVELNSILAWFNNADIQLNLKLRLKSKYSELKSEINTLLNRFDYSKFINEDLYNLGDFFKHLDINHRDVAIKNEFFENLIALRNKEEGYWFLVFRMIPFLEEDFIFKNITRDWFKLFFKGIKQEINSLGFELYGAAFPEFEEVERYKKLCEEKRYKEAQKMPKKQRADFKQNTYKNWYPRYLSVKEKLNVLKASQPYGYKLYEKIIHNFSHLQALEENQFNRYMFNKEKKWW